MNLSGVSKDTWTRLIILIITLVNMALNQFGITHFTNEDINEWYDVISVFVAVASSLWCMWKNNSFTLNAQTADKVLKSLRDCVDEVYEDEDQ